MVDNDILIKAQALAEYIESRHFAPVTQRTPYFHMGATITDSVLQAGLNYRCVVYPRVLKLLTKFPNYRTTCDFLILMQTIPLPELIEWSNKRKLELIQNISWLLFDNGVETEPELAVWLNSSKSISQLQKLKGVGPKTIDYLSMLSGNQAIAIDRHLFAFLRLAGIITNSYSDASVLYKKAADILSLSAFELDRQIWRYMSDVVL